MRIALARSDARGVQTFYAESASRPGSRWTVKLIRRGETRWLCSCPDFIHRRAQEGESCKHIRHCKRLVRLAGGVNLLREIYWRAAKAAA